VLVLKEFIDNGPCEDVGIAGLPTVGSNADDRDTSPLRRSCSVESNSRAKRRRVWPEIGRAGTKSKNATAPRDGRQSYRPDFVIADRRHRPFGVASL
jgi:hypothetical protein